jgi:phenylpropionate dioxygenase-like ring-hydroxylating dioxygenase large terminal subunit
VIERIEGGLRVTRWYLGLDVPPYLKGLAAFDGPVDRWQVYEWRSRGCLFDMDSGIRPAGRAPGEPADDLPRHRFHNVQSITPETERSSHFFWSYPRDFALDDRALTDTLAERLVEGFVEDKTVIEAQQKSIDAHPGRKMAAIAADAGLMQGRSMLARLLEAEGG